MAQSEIKTTLETNETPSELDSSIWSVVSFERCEASGLTYSEAVRKLEELEAQRIAGLCIVSDESGARVPAA